MESESPVPLPERIARVAGVPRPFRRLPAHRVPAAPVSTLRGSLLATPDFLALYGDAAVLNWTMQLRWVMLAALLALGLILGLAGALPWRMFLAPALLGVPVAAYNLLFLVLLHLAPLWDNPRMLRLLRWLQIPPDVVVLTISIHLVGGATTPLPILYVYFIITAIVLMPRYGTYVAAALGTICYGTLAALELLYFPPRSNAALATADVHAPNAALLYGWHLLALVAIFWLVAYVANLVARRIQAGEDLIQHRLTDLTLLYRFSDNLTSAPNLEQAMQYIVTELAGFLSAGSCSLMLLNAQGQAEFRAATGIPPEALLAYRQHPLGPDNPLLTAVLNGGSGIFAPDVDAVPGLRAVLIRPGTRSFYSFPLRTEEKVVGLLNFSFAVRYSLPPSVYDLVVACARQAGLVIERTILYQDAQRAAREMTSLYRVGLATSSSLEIDRVLRQIAEHAQAVLSADALVLALYDERSRLLDYVLVREQAVELPHQAALPVDQAGSGGWIVQNRQPLLIRHWDQEIAHLPFVSLTNGLATQSYIGAPLVAANRVVGVLSVQKIAPYAYNETHVRLLSAIAAQAALALENARLHEAVRQQAQRDSLTGAYNHAALIAAIDRSVDRARVSAGTVALVMLDIDLFKHYNDTHGHVAGDDALRLVVKAITENVKSTDVIGRWGGEEFGVLLPGATYAAALAVAQRIRTTLAELTVPAGNGRLPAPTVSQGVACYPTDSQSSAQLVDHADSALYRAKDVGRDTVVCWQESAAETS